MKIKDRELALADKTRPTFAGIIKGMRNCYQIARRLIVLLDYVLFDTPIYYTLCTFLLVFFKINNAIKVLAFSIIKYHSIRSILSLGNPHENVTHLACQILKINSDTL